MGVRWADPPVIRCTGACGGDRTCIGCRYVETPWWALLLIVVGALVVMGVCVWAWV